MTRDRIERPPWILCVGASAGGVTSLKEFVGAIPRDLPAAVLVVLHIGATQDSALAAILERNGPLPVRRAVDGDPLRGGCVFVAPPDRHLTVRDGRVRVLHGPRENRTRPAIDPLFRSAAAAYGPRVVAVALSGTGADGAAGAAAVKHAGGRVLVQDPAEAVFGEMPRSVLEHVEVDAVGPAAGLPGIAVDLATTMPPAGGARPAEPPDRGGDDMATGLTCPDCGGALWERGPEAADRFECRVGHSFGAETLVASHDENLENVLWSAVRAFEERAELSRRLEERFRRRGDAAVAERYRRRVDESMRHAASLRDALVGGDLVVDVAEEA